MAYESGAQAIFYKPTHLRTLGKFMARALTPEAQRFFRKCERYSAQLTGKLAFGDLPAQDSVIMNLSLGGMFVQSTGYHPQIDQKFAFQTDGGVQIDGLAVVRWLRNQGDNSLLRGFGAEFAQLTPQARAALERFVIDQRNRMLSDL